MVPVRPKPGYPQRHYDELHRTWRTAVNLFVITGTFALILLLWCIYLNGSLFLAALALAVFILLGLLGGVFSLYDTWRYVRIIPYFPRPVGEIDTFLAGEALARNLEQLDEVAEDQGVRPLSAFGFNDDLFHEQVVWHQAVSGIETVRTIRIGLETKSEVVRDRQAVLSDLQKLEHALERAAAQAIPFCLLLRHGNSTSGQEWDVRKGTAF